jgi:hypothetical protein
VGRRDELACVDGEVIGDGSGVGTVLDQRGNGGEAELFV